MLLGGTRRDFRSASGPLVVKQVVDGRVAFARPEAATSEFILYPTADELSDKSSDCKRTVISLATADVLAAIRGSADNHPDSKYQSTEDQFTRFPLFTRVAQLSIYLSLAMGCLALLCPITLEMQAQND